MARKRRGRGEGSIFESKAKGVWVGRAKAAGGRVEVTARTKAEAMEKLRKAVVAKSVGTVAAAATTTVGEYLSRWLSTVAAPSVEPTTLELYDRTIRVHVAPALGGVRLADLTAERAEAFFAGLHESGVVGGLAKKIRQVLQTALRHAVKRKLLPSSPMDGVPCPKAGETEVIPFTGDEVKAILAACEPQHRMPAGGRYAAYFALAFATGARQGELLGLGWEHLDCDRAIMRVERSLCVVGGEYRLKAPKSKRGRRTVSLPPFAAEAVRRHRERMTAEGRLGCPVFCTRKSGDFLSRAMVHELWKGVLRRAGVAYRKLHCARHTHASVLLGDGVSLVEVARRLGDHPETILKVYGHWVPSDARVSDRLESFYGREGGNKVEGAG